MESGKMGGEAIMLGPVPRGGDTERRRTAWAQRSSLKNEGLNHILENPALGYNTRKTSPLGWFENQWDRRGTVRNLDSASEEHEHAPENRQKQQLKLPETLAGFLQPPSAHPGPC